MKTALVSAQQSLHDARCDAEAAEAVLAKAEKNRTEVGALALDSSADLDKSALAVSSASHKCDIAAGRLRLARDRVVVAEAAVQQTTIAERQSELLDAEANLANQDDTVLALVREFLASIAQPLADLLAARDHRNGIVSRLASLGATARAAEPGAASRALKVGVPDSKTALAKIRAGEMVEPQVSSADTVTSLVAWIVGEPKREQEARANAEQRERDRERQRQLDALAGKFGSEAQDAALLEERRSYARNQRARPSDPSILGSDYYAEQAITTRTLPATDEVE